MKKKSVQAVFIKTCSTGMGLFAGRDFKKDEVVVSGRRLRVLKQRSKYSFQYDKNLHIMLDAESRKMNHSCDPSLGVRNNTFGAYDFIALHDIKKGEELTWDYETVEYEVGGFRSCLCKSKHCRKVIRGFKYSGLYLLLIYDLYIADYLQECVKDLFTVAYRRKNLYYEEEKI